MSQLSDQLNQLIEACHHSATANHDQIYSLEKAFEAEDEMIIRHIDDVIARAEDRRRAMFARLTTVANMMGIVPVRQVPPQVQINDNMQMPRVARAPQPPQPLSSEQHANAVFDAFNTPKKAVGAR